MDPSPASRLPFSLSVQYYQGDIGTGQGILGCRAPLGPSPDSPITVSGWKQRGETRPYRPNDHTGLPLQPEENIVPGIVTRNAVGKYTLYFSPVT